MRMKLGKRLDTVLSLIKEGETLCDVGTDHGKLPVAALLSGRARAAVAIDISAPSLAKARLLAEQEGVPLRCLVGDGLSPLGKDETDIVVIAGMGGAEIVKILKEAPRRYPRYVFVPHRDSALVRGYLKEQNARILKDISVKEGEHFYFVIEATFSLPWREKSLWFGSEGEDFEAYKAYRLQKIEKLLSFKQDPSLIREKEELTDAQALGNRGGA